MRKPATFLVLVAILTPGLGGPADQRWGPPYRVIYGGYSMKSDDWSLWEGVFNLIHHSLLGRDPAETRLLLEQAGERNMKILTTANIREPTTGQIDASELRDLVERVGDAPALFGYVFEAAYRIPPAAQKKVYDTIKRVDPSRPVWMEFSSTSAKTWQLFNPAACDAIFTYNYPYERKDRAGANVVRRVSYSVRAIEAVNARGLAVVPILHAFQGTRWRAAPRGGMAAQFDRWLDLRTVAGVSFYRWRGRSPYGGLLADGTEDNYTWEEAQELSRQLAEQAGPFVDAAQWRKAAGRPTPTPVGPATTEPAALPPRTDAADVPSFTPTSMLLDQDWEDTAVGMRPPMDWSVGEGMVVAGGAMGTARAVKVTKGGLAFALDRPTASTDAVRLTLAISPSGKGYARGMVTLSDARSGYIAVGLRLGHGTGPNSNVFSHLGADGKWRSLGVGFLPGRWYHVVITAGGNHDDVSYRIEDLQSEETQSRSTKRRFSGRGFRQLRLSSDHASSVAVDELRIETGTLK